jgi:hypothetical protein
MLTARLQRLPLLLILCAVPALSGCVALGVVAGKMPPPTILPKYNLGGQSVGILVWADRGVTIDWPTLQLDLGNAIERHLATSKDKEMLGATFPVHPASILRWQEDHPESEGSPITMIAPRLTVSRLIYVELDHFSTRSNLSVDLFRGTATATVKVVEVQDNKATIAFTEPGVSAAFPPKAPKEGVPNAGDAKIYTGTVEGIATQVSNIFLRHEQEE